MKSAIVALLSEVIHPETELNIVESEIVESINADEEKITVSLLFR